MIQSALKRASLLVPQIRRLKQEKDLALRQVADLSRRLAELESANSPAQALPPSSNTLDTSNVVAQAVSQIRAEFTEFPRFGFHIPLDHELLTVPPLFEPSIWVGGDPLPLPPSAERHGHDDAKYLDWGKYDHDVLLDHIRRRLPSIDNLTIMDFGCSSGRVLRHFLPEMQQHNWKVIGVDVSARRIEWMRLNFPPEFLVYTGTAMPHLPFESNSLDVIYGLSVFTHLKFLWDMWLLELRRVLKPGGLLIQTIHTENAWDFFSKHGNEDWARNALGPLFINESKIPHDYVLSGDICDNQTFWKKDVARAFWGRYFKDVNILPPPEQYWYQDWVIASKQ